MFLWADADNRYQRQEMANLRRKAMAAPELQLSRLRGPSSSMVSEYNPNYEFGPGAPCSVQGLKEIPRENLRLVRLVVHFQSDPFPILINFQLNK